MTPRFFFLFFLLSLHLLHGSPVENGAAPQIIQKGFFIPRSCWVDVRAGYEGDFVGNEKLEQTQEGSGRVDTFAQTTNSATITLNILDRLDLYGLFGSSRVCADWRFNWMDTVTRIQLETFYRFLWGAGARGILFEWGNLFLGAGGRYSSCHYKPSWLTSNGVPQETSGTHMNWDDWQVDLTLSYKIDLFIPYIGAQYANATADLGSFAIPISGNGSGSDHFESRIPVGMVIGCTISNGRYFLLNIEGRVINEDALTISGDLRF